MSLWSDTPWARARRWGYSLTHDGKRLEAGVHVSMWGFSLPSVGVRFYGEDRRLTFDFRIGTASMTDDGLTTWVGVTLPDRFADRAAWLFPCDDGTGWLK